MNDKIKLLQEKANQIRKLIIEMLTVSGSGHPGGSLSIAEIMSCLYFEVLRLDPHNPNWSGRDRFHLSKGHACPAFYAALAMRGYFDMDELMNLRKLGALLQGHSDCRVPGIDVSSGSLGQGLSIALGMSLAGKLDKRDYRVYCIMGDGELQEGSIWEAAMAAAHFKQDTLCGIEDNNRFQIDGRVADIMNVEPLAKKWESFGWHVICCDGHNVAELLSAFDQARNVKGKPTVIIAHTTKGKGVSFMEDVVDFHGRAPTPEEKEIALRELKDISNL